MEAPAEEVFQWHAEPGALERLTPPWEHVEVEQPSPGIHNGDKGVLRVKTGPFRIRWSFEHRDYIEGRQFRDVQLAGPFRRWDHTHRFIADGSNACWVEDDIKYELPFGLLGKLLGGWFVRRKLVRLFEYRHRITAEALATKGNH
jgi:ligand-binding SRPBCC domain-containing protein